MEKVNRRWGGWYVLYLLFKFCLQYDYPQDLKKTRTEILWFLLWKSIRSFHFDIFFKKKSHKYIERLKPKTNQDSKHHFPEMWQLEWLFFCAAHRKRDSGLLFWAFACLQIVRQHEGGRTHLPAFLQQSLGGLPRGAPFPVLLPESPSSKRKEGLGWVILEIGMKHLPLDSNKF